MDTLALTTDWDLDVDDRGNWRTVGTGTPTREDTGPGMRLAQDAATRLRAWRGEVWMDGTQGVDYPRYLGTAPAIVELSADLQSEALLVPECRTALADVTLARGSRTVGGTLYLSDLEGFAAEVSL